MSRVLVVDDEEAYCSLMSGHLERKGFEVERANNGLSALDVLQESGPFDVLVTDLAMPGMSGLDLLRQSKQLDEWLEVIVITASDDVDTAVEVMREGGAYDYLIKPLETISELSMAVRRAAQHRSLRLEREYLDEQLTIEAARLQTLVSNTGDAIISTDGEGKLTVVNPAAAEIIGRLDGIGARALEVLPQELTVCVENWEEIGEGVPVVVEINWPIDTVQLVSLAPLGGTTGGDQGWVMVLRDITHLRNLDEFKMRMLTEAAGRIRIPLAQAVSNLAELGDSTKRDDEQYSATIYQLAKLLGRIQTWMDELLALVRIEAGIGYQQAEVNLTEILNSELIHQFEEARRDSDLHLEINLEDNLPHLRVDPALMEKMIQGLIGRAANRSQRGGMIHVSARRHRGQVWIEVMDEGIPNRGRNSDPFFTSSDGLLDGEGLGLEMVRAIVGRMGGQVWVKGQGSVGSTIAISLPEIPEESRDDGPGAPRSCRRIENRVRE